MINKKVPGFSFSTPTIRVLDIRVESRIVVGETRAIRAVWTPELAQDLQAFHNIDAEAELTALLAENIRREIDDQIIRDLRNGMGNDVYNHLREWTNLVNNQPLIHRGHRAPQDEPPILGGGFGNIAFPMVRRVAAQTMGMDLVAVQPLELPTGLLNYIDFNYNVLPNEEGWYTSNTFESLFINMYLKQYKFLEKKRRSRRDRFRI